MKLLLDEMYSIAIAEQLRARGHDVVSVNEPAHDRLRAAPDAEVFRAAMAEGRAVVTENVVDFVKFETEASASELPRPALVYTTHRQFPRDRSGQIGSLVNALDALLTRNAALPVAHYLEPVS